MGETPLPRGRGIDERAARAAAEVRKKAAARGLLVRPHGVPVQALPPLTQLLNIINSGVVQEAPTDVEANVSNEEASSSAVNATGNATENGCVGSQEGQAPVGLGTGLAALDLKKQKCKPKATT